MIDIESQVSKQNINTWFKNTQITKKEDGIVFLGVPNEFIKTWLSDKYHKFILKALRDVGEDIRGVEYVVYRNIKDAQKAQEGALMNTKLPLDDLYINKEDNLNPRYTFDSFIIGAFNEVAHAAAHAIIQKSCVYNPLFIYGGTGLGKTHLIQAVGNHIKKQNPTKRVYYMSSEKFTTEFVSALQKNTAGQFNKHAVGQFNKIHQFKEQYRNYDVFIMDDVQFLAGREETQKELFHLFNEMYDNNKQIIFSSDQHPNHIPNLEERLKSRFNAGMIVDVQQPEYESRMAILKTKAATGGLSIPDDTISHIASLVQGNIRELEGVLNLIVCHAQLKKQYPSAQDIKSIIKNNIKQRKVVSVSDVVKTVSSFYNIEEATIYEKTRKKEVVKPRQVIMYLLREDFNISYPSIGQKLGGRDHTTVIHSCEKIKESVKNDVLLCQEIDQIRAMF